MRWKETEIREMIDIEEDKRNAYEIVEANLSKVVRAITNKNKRGLVQAINHFGEDLEKYKKKFPDYQYSKYLRLYEDLKTFYCK